MRNKNFFVNGLRFTGIIFFLLIIYKYDLNIIFSNLKETILFFFAIFLLLEIPVVLLKGYKSKYLVESFGGQISLLDSTKIWLMGFYLGSLTPGKVGDFSRTLFLSDNAKVNNGTSFFCVFIERILDLLSLALLGLFSLFILFGDEYSSSLGFPLFILLMLLVLCSFAFLNSTLNYQISRIFFRIIPFSLKSSLRNFYKDFQDTVKRVVGKKREIAIFFLLTILCYSLIFFQIFVLSLSLGFNITFLNYFFIVPLIIIVEALPISIIGIGVRDWTLILILEIYEILPEKAISFSMCILFLALLDSIIGYFFLIKYKFSSDL